MKKILLPVFLILGIVIGSGFSTGKEIFVFFTQFGILSLIFIPIAGILFYFSFYFLMTKGLEKLKKFKMSKILSFLFLFCAVIFSSSMFAGISTIGESSSRFLSILLMLIILILCFFASYKKQDFLSKVNFYLVPILLGIILIFFIFKLPSLNFLSIIPDFCLKNFLKGGVFSFLYVILNISLSSTVIAECGKSLTKKQIKLVCLLSAIILSAFMLMINILILCNYDLYDSQMPLLEIGTGVFVPLLKFVIMLGCLTTLLADVYVAGTSVKSLGINEKFSFVICVIFPYFLSKIGFSNIVSVLYPFVSTIGIFLLFLIFFKRST